MPVTETHIAVAEALLNIEAAMRNLQLWQEQEPPAEALASTQPFAVDTLTFTQWLQFLLIPRLRQLAESGGPLPVNCAIAPMAEESFRAQNLVADSLLAELRRIDQLLTH